MKNPHFPAIALTSLLCVAGSATAAPVVFSEQLPDLTTPASSIRSDTSGVLPEDAPLATAGAPAGYQLTRIEWWGFGLLYDSNGDGFEASLTAFQVTFNGNLLTGTISEVSTTAFPSGLGVGELVLYALDLDSTPVLSQTTNSLGTFNGNLDAEWYWQTSANGAPSYRLIGEAPTADLPEPASLALVLAALVAAGSARRRGA